MYTVEYYSATERNEFESVELRWMTLEAQSKAINPQDTNQRKEREGLKAVGSHIYSLCSLCDEKG